MYTVKQVFFIVVHWAHKGSLLQTLSQEFYHIRKTDANCSSHCSSDSKYVIDSQQKNLSASTGREIECTPSTYSFIKKEKFSEISHYVQRGEQR